MNFTPVPDAPFPMFVFTDNLIWSAKITSFKIGVLTLTETRGQSSGDYVFGFSNIAPPPAEVEEGKKFNPALFPNNEQYIITLKSAGYPDVTLTVQGPIAQLN